MPSPLTKQSLIEWFHSGKKSRKQDLRIGSEHERFLFQRDNRRPLAYEGESGICATLSHFNALGGWEGVFEGSVLVAMKHKNGAFLTLEPGGQFELSGAPLQHLHQTCSEITQFDVELKEVCTKLGNADLMTGFLPQWKREEVPQMPKRRYGIMRAHMEKTGTLGLDMMHRSATVQVNLDYYDEADMVAKMRLATALQPLSVALFANSPFLEGKKSGFLSWRSHCWSKTDAARCGLPLFVFDKSFSYERWVDYLLDVPVYFIRRGDQYYPVKESSFLDLMEGRADMPPMPDAPDISGGRHLIMQDFEDHLGSVFPEVRLKKFIEMRGSDGTPRDFLCALPAFWVGLLYDSAAMAACNDLVKNWRPEALQQLQHDVAIQGFNAKIDGVSLQKLALECLAIARDGLKARGHLNSEGADEAIFLNPLFEIAETGVTLAEKALEQFDKEGNVDFLYREALQE